MSAPGVTEVEAFMIYRESEPNIHFLADRDLAVKVARGEAGETGGRAHSDGATVLVELDVDGMNDCVRVDADSNAADLDRAIAALSSLRDEITRMQQR